MTTEQLIQILTHTKEKQAKSIQDNLRVIEKSKQFLKTFNHGTINDFENQRP